MDQRTALQAQPAATRQPHGPAHRVVERLLRDADVRLDGRRPWDIRLKAQGVPERWLAHGSLGLGESYMDGHWECESLDQMFDRVLRTDIGSRVKSMGLVWHHLRARVLNLQTERRAWHVGRAHYDLGNDFYEAMLGRHMVYTCGYWERGGQPAATLDAAQENKLDLVCRKLGLAPGMRVLDVGCGWGDFMAYAARHYGVECVGVTVSAEQAALGRERCAGLPVDIRLADYRRVNERFDRIVSLGMFEHVGHKNYATYMNVARRCLKQSGLFLLHTVGRNERGRGTDPWAHRYVFPNGELPTIAQIGAACEGRFVVEDLHNLGADYDRTLMAWHANFEAAWPRFAERLGPRFHRMWRYYLLSSAGAFRARDLQLWQWVLSRPGRRGAYRRAAA